MKRHVWQPEDKHAGLRGKARGQGHGAHAGHAQRDQRAKWEQCACDPTDAIGLDQAECTNQQPRSNQNQQRRQCRSRR